MNISAATISEGWEKSILAILKSHTKNGAMVPTERGASAAEIENIMIEIKKPLADKRISDRCQQRSDFSSQYVKNLFDQSYHQQVYSRITSLKASNKEINQKLDVVKKLKEAWYSRRSVVSLWQAGTDIISDHPPCICVMQFYIRNDNLCLTSFYRSNDAWGCAPGDMLAITNLQKEVADEMGVRVGAYTHVATSYHIYDFDLPAAYSAFDSEVNHV